jgi:hypothetical protein
MRSLAAFMVSAAGSGGMGRVMVRAHDLKEAAGHDVESRPSPGRPPVLLVDRTPWLSPFGLHALTVAEKPR